MSKNFHVRNKFTLKFMHVASQRRQYNRHIEHEKLQKKNIIIIIIIVKVLYFFFALI